MQSGYVKGFEQVVVPNIHIIRVYLLFNANSSDKFFFFNNRGRSLAVLCRAKE